VQECVVGNTSVPGIAGAAAVLHYQCVPAQIEGKQDRGQLSPTKLERRAYQQARATGTTSLVSSCMTQSLSRGRRLQHNGVDGIGRLCDSGSVK